MKFFLLIILLVISVSIGTLWLASHLCPWHDTFTIHGNAYSLQNQGGTASLVIFSTTAEDAAYHHLQMRYWIAEAVTLPLTALFLLFYLRRRKQTRGFPV